MEFKPEAQLTPQQKAAMIASNPNPNPNPYPSPNPSSNPSPSPSPSPSPGPTSPGPNPHPNPGPNPNQATMIASLLLVDYMFFEQDNGMVSCEGGKLKITLCEACCSTSS